VTCVRVTVRLKGQLCWYDKERRREVTLEATSLTVRAILQELGIPESELYMATVDGAKTSLDQPLKDGATVELLPAIGGG